MPVQDSHGDLAHQLAAHLQQEAAHVSNFVELLEREAVLLAAAHSPQDMQVLAREKTAIAEMLEQHESRRHELARSLGAEGGGRKTMAVLVRQHPVLARPWSILCECVHLAAERNRRNASTLAIYLKHIDSMLDHMREMREQNALYDARGRRQR